MYISIINNINVIGSYIQVAILLQYAVVYLGVGLVGSVPYQRVLVPYQK